MSSPVFDPTPSVPPRQIAEIARLGRGWLVDLDWSADGKSLAIASSLGVWVHDFDAQIARMSAGVLLESDSATAKVDLNSTGALVAYFVEEGRDVILRDTKTGNTHAIWPHSARLDDILFSPDGEFLIAADRDYQIGVWNVSTGELEATLQHDTRVTSMVFNTAGTVLASGTRDGAIRLWDVETWTEIAVQEGQEGKVSSMTFAQDDLLLSSVVFADEPLDATHLITVATGTWGEQLVHTDQFISAAFSPDVTQFALSDFDDQILIWDIAAREIAMVLAAPDVMQFAFSPDGRILAIGNLDGSIRLVDIESGEQMAEIIGNSVGAFDVAFSPGGASIALPDISGIKLWNISTNELTLVGDDNYVYTKSLAFSPDGSLLVSGGFDGVVRLWDVDTGTQVRAMFGHSSEVESVAFSPDGRLVASAGGYPHSLQESDNTVHVWDVDSGAELMILQHSGFVQSVAFSPDGRFLATGTGVIVGTAEPSEAFVRMWNVETGTEILRLEGHVYPITAVAFSPDGSMLFSGSKERLNVWDIESGDQVLSLLTNADPMAASPDGTLLALAGGCLWDISTQMEYAVLHHRGIISDLAFSPDGSLLVSAGWDGTVRIWSVQ